LAPFRNIIFFFVESICTTTFLKGKIIVLFWFWKQRGLCAFLYFFFKKGLYLPKPFLFEVRCCFDRDRWNDVDRTSPQKLIHFEDHPSLLSIISIKIYVRCTFSTGKFMITLRNYLSTCSERTRRENCHGGRMSPLSMEFNKIQNWMSRYIIPNNEFFNRRAKYKYDSKYAVASIMIGETISLTNIRKNWCITDILLITLALPKNLLVMFCIVILYWVPRKIKRCFCVDLYH